ncbi:uncharacterized protein LY89DRAFT_754327 [Mollisia scopiformis]|uniref:2EXR domain-containing protein n=1 Tax=Mollisia scopiformis TaxID=149040 RepID=A0A194WZY9_MOLSC|nr:uncharacterized protein LY89DRAFT_754327 [Mollisia scopiformis]KUJ13516.1 hypothetical protein LY89DRAFT_754327 [Mollisia scopiformis]
MSPENNITDAGESRSAPQLLQTSHFFSELPNEIQDMIWVFAIFPRRIRFDLRGNRRWAVNNEFFHTAVQQRLLSLCKASRAVATHTLGATRTLYFPPRELVPGSVVDVGFPANFPPIPFHFLPDKDTLYLPGVGELLEVSGYGHITTAGQEGDLGGMAAVKSLSLANFLHRIIYLPPEHVLATLDGGHIWVSGATGGYRGLCATLCEFIGLEELIVISPPWAKLVKMRMVKWEGERVINSDVNECQQRIKDFKISLENELRSYLDQKAELRSDGDNPGLHYYRGQRMSRWWLNPKITIITENEFDSRFL